MLSKAVIFFAVVFIILIICTAMPVARDESEIDSVMKSADLELDHIYICVSMDAPEAKVLQDAGFRLAGDTMHHSGQGTASVFFCFENAYLELCWIENLKELENADQEYADKLKNIKNGASPFGLGLRRSAPSSDSLPFKTRLYSADWMKPGSTIEIAEVNNMNEPEIFVVPPYMGWDSLLAMAQNNRPEMLDDLEHPIGTKKLTSVKMTGPGLTAETQAMAVLAEREIVSFGKSEDHLLELTFDEGKEGNTIDARPALPLILNY